MCVCLCVCASSNSSHAVTVFVDAMKITMNVLQKNASGFCSDALEHCSWSSLSPSVPPEEQLQWLRARVEDILKTCQHFLLKGEVRRAFFVFLFMMIRDQAVGSPMTSSCRQRC